MISNFKNVCLIILFCLINVHCFAYEDLPSVIYAKVIKVIDGDTIHLRNKKYGKIKVRLAEIDAPERDQPYGEEAKVALKKIILNKSVKLNKVAIDRYNRVIGIVYYNDLEINYFLVRNGFAWCYDKYNKREKIKNAENYARSEKIGIWLYEKNVIAPWDWRKNKRKTNE
tara:strand:- start:361 stop:870 length:510 start_codon:yes stop_codon:yes gene_type:complete